MRFYTSIADNYEYIFPYKQFKVDFIDSFLKKGSNILDIGCDIGDLSNGLEEDNKIENLIELYPITKYQIGQILHETGYKDIEFFSDFKGNDFKKDALPLVFKAVKE
ncbi:MAG: hypothetical protein C0601_04465 [Candidatus Muiribacterium halophilum]|uniref:Uncharacterized protein n=1 Tax=Muiribacterium halophilum TaxID=2053465 RepID=A0A2N5ZIF9_MUIH1|nr:MAG: hypothetical protein C0601_04465 [Candidatus Muirbacterium halophilum]